MLPFLGPAGLTSPMREAKECGEYLIVATEALRRVVLVAESLDDAHRLAAKALDVIAARRGCNPGAWRDEPLLDEPTDFAAEFGDAVRYAAKCVDGEAPNE